MRYSDDFTENEDQKTVNGEREIISYPVLTLFLGEDNHANKDEEMLLDILNRQYPLDDAISDVIEHYKQHLEI